MSRAHMLYSNDKLSNLPVKITTWHKRWNANEIFKCQSGNGLIIEGVVLGKSRHTIVDGVDNNTKFRYIAVSIKILNAVRRKFDGSGKEIEPDFRSTKISLTGYLSSKTVSKEGEDVLTPEQTVQLLKVENLDALNKDLSTSNCPNSAVIWFEEKDMDGMDVTENTTVRLRTKGDGPYLESIVCLDDETKRKVNYTTGKDVGGSWTDKVLNVKDEKEQGSHLTEDSSAVDDDEWDD